MRLNAEQKVAVETDGHLVVSAGPGSGKTGGVIIPKALRLLESGRSAIVVTFTRSAADEVTHRIAKLCPPEHLKRLMVGTFHKVIMFQMRRANRARKVLAPLDQYRAMTAALIAADVDKFEDRETALRDIEVYKRSLDSQPITNPVSLRVFEEYTAQLANLNAIDLNDLIVQAVHAMRDKDNPLPGFKPGLLLVDEFHDVDEPQLEWTLLHAQAGIPTCIVADDDQAIYSFRASLGYAAIKRFQKATNAQQVMLNTNYRSHQEITDLAARLIEHNKFRLSKDIQSAKGYGGSVTLLDFETRAEEMASVVNRLRDTSPVNPETGKREHAPGEWMVITRNNAQLDLLALELHAAGVKVANMENDKIWQKRPLSTYAKLLKSLGSGDKVDRHLDDALNNLNFEPSELDAFREGCRASKDTVRSWLLEKSAKMPDGVRRSGPTYQRLKELMELYPRWVDMHRASGNRSSMPPLLIEAVVQFLLDTLNATNADSLADQVRMLRVGADILLVERGDVLQRLSSAQDVKDRAPGSDSNEPSTGVTLYTMHGSKGLEAENVWVMSCDASTIPSPEPETNIEEERRLMYVAITRAKTHLTVSYAKLGNGKRRPKEFFPSPFLLELGYSDSGMAVLCETA